MFSGSRNTGRLYAGLSSLNSEKVLANVGNKSSRMIDDEEINRLFGVI